MVAVTVTAEPKIGLVTVTVKAGPKIGMVIVTVVQLGLKLLKFGSYSTVLNSPV